MSIETTRTASNGLTFASTHKGAKEAAAVESKNVSMRRDDTTQTQPLTQVGQVVDPSQGSLAGSKQKQDVEEAISFPELVNEVEKLNIATQNIQRSLEFTVDDDVEKTIITVRDRETEEVIRQIPAEELINISKRLRAVTGELEEATGFLFSSSA